MRNLRQQALRAAENFEQLAAIMGEEEHVIASWLLAAGILRSLAQHLPAEKVRLEVVR